MDKVPAIGCWELLHFKIQIDEFINIGIWTVEVPIIVVTRMTRGYIYLDFLF